MKTVLKQGGNPLIERVDTLIEDRITNIDASTTLIPKETKRVLMAGFSMSDTVLPPKEAAELIAATKNKAHAYKARRDQFAAALEGTNISYKAILPTKLFNQLCKEFGLIRFEHFDADGKVHTNRTRTEMHQRLGIGTILPAMVFACLAIGGLAAFLLGIGLWGVIATATITSLIGFGAWRLNVERMGSNPKFIQWLFGDVSTKNKRPSVLAIFPALPTELTSILKSLQPLHEQGRLFTAALPDAVKVQMKSIIELAESSASDEKVMRSATEAAQAEELAQERAERIRQRMLNEEPIVYSLSSDQTMVAAHFQFGEFPREKEFMQRIENISDAELFSLVD